MSQDTVQSIERALTILECFSFENHSITFTELVEATGLKKATAHRIIHTLLQHGFLRYNEATMRYGLGIKLIRFGQIANDSFSLKEMSRPVVERLRDLTQETIHLVVLDDGQALYIDKIESRFSVRTSSVVGQKLFVHSTAVGKVLLSRTSDEEIRSILARWGMQSFTPNTITDADDFINEVRRAEKNGYSIDNEENEIGLRCLAAPIFGANGDVVAAISMSGPINRVTLDKINDISNQLIEGTREISALF